MVKTVYRRIRRYMPAASFWLFLLALLCAALHGFCTGSTSFADFFNENIGAFFRGLFARLSGWIPFSLAETLILLIPAFFIVFLIVCLRQARRGWRQAMYCVIAMLSVAALLYSMFVLTFGAGYHSSPLDEKMDMEAHAVTADELAFTAMVLVSEMTQELEEIRFCAEGASNMPYSYDELSEKLMDAYDRVTQEYPFIQKLESRVKPVALSEPWTYTHISGVYTMFTGEANLNVNYPDYVLPYTAAHELAHQRGIARENEANFVAFLVCTAADDPYIRYSGYLNLYEYVASALYSASPEYYKAVYSSLDSRVIEEMRSYSRFFEKYRDTVVSDVSDAVNNTYLVLQGTEGAKSYGMVVDLAVAYVMKQYR